MPVSPAIPVNAQTAPAGSAELLLLEQVRLLYASLAVSQTVTLLNGIVLAAVQSFVIEPARVIGWLVCLVLVTLARIVLGNLFRRDSHAASDISRWRTYFLAGALAAGMVWGSAAFILYPQDSLVHQVFIAFVLGGMVLGAMVQLISVYQAFVLFALCTLLPTIVRYLFAGDYIHYAMSGMGVLFLLAVLVMGKRIHDTLTASLQLRFENRELIVHLTDAKERVESINKDLLAAQQALRSSNEVLESRVAERTAALETVDRRKNDFLAMLSHELRNPLAPIRNSIYILGLADPASGHALRARQVIERQIQHVTRLVDDLLDVTRIARGKIQLRLERVNLTDLVRRTAEDQSTVFEMLDVGLATNVPELPVWVIVDPTRIAQMIGNLLRNAAKFTPAAGRVALCLQVVDESVEIRVSDTGAGIEPELLPELFEPFVQGKQSLARTDGGLGLGLALVKGIIAMHHGTVEVRSGGAGKGSTFIVRLPRVIENVVHDAPGRPAQHITTSRHIIVVDDNRDAADSLAQLVELFGHSADVAYDGATAIEKVRANRPDVVLCDLGLPGMTGYEVARALRAQRIDVLLIAVSGYAQFEDIAKAHAAGFDDHIAKPPDPETLRALLSHERRRRPRADTWAS